MADIKLFSDVKDYEEIEDNKSYKIFEYSRLSSGMVLYNYVYIFEDR